MVDVRRLSGGLVTACVTVVLAACHQEASHAADPPPVEPSVSAQASIEPAPAPEFHENTFDLVLRPAGAFAAGKPGSAEIQVSAKNGYHCNDKYPYKFKTSESPGVAYSSPVFTKDALHLEPGTATMKVDFTPDSKGQKTIAGVFAFSLCSAERCLVEKRNLALNIAVD
jgi:hypothetical protein